MAQPPDQDAIQAEIERLRAHASDTKSLYREAAAALFFRFGIAPTANRLHQLVGKGSMATAATALAGFWKDLREQGRLRIEHPAVPDALRDAAGAFIGEIWKAAINAAARELEALRQEVKAQLASAQAEAEKAERRALHAEELTAALRDDVDRLTQDSRNQAEVASVRALELERLNEQLRASAVALRDRETEVQRARSAFSAELDRLRVAIDLTEERARAAERRALADVDAARLAAKQADKALREEQRARATDLKRLDAAIGKREAEIQQLREKLVRAEAIASTTKTHLARTEERLSTLIADARKKAPVRSVSGSRKPATRG